MEFDRSIEAVLLPLADPARAAGMRAYMRGQFEYLGIPTPARRLAIRSLVRSFNPAQPEALRGAALALWSRREREYHYAAADLLVHHSGALGAADISWLLELAQQKAWWDSVDALAKVVGRVVRASGARGKKQMDRAIHAKDMWVRRIAMIHQLGWRGETDTVRLFRYAEILAPESEFFLRKAAGWALRDYAWHDWRAVAAFLKRAGDRISPLTYREATKNFPALKNA